ncbi:dihydropteroate synthase [Sulfurihydrogenibium azorense]|uniref:Dihydropteroate synthase n=1 Tax=Sulfurihydrogenibium azorense (strain DSM 15241 / OCM 825 / Az-Fu1) TaxID=204536 RepID=C1DWV3_SULAA|nr:dihydropteroate synthase [Sulfurihydrogenibium azorense]ACN99638.1 dihydropteroate synthase [Sulfurihydrogenibium azorense Az-Fu1]MDM7273379.1 dihydropteroate synthase [Sulfurihydrogenibium azorense]
MRSFPVIKQINKSVYKIYFSDPFLTPVVIENEDQFKEIINQLLANNKREEAKELSQQWVNLSKKHFKINYKGKFLNLGVKTAIMGVVNVTPDSFSNGSENYKDTGHIVDKVARMLEYGADIIDVGGESTRPGADPVPAEEELDRVIPVIKALRKELGDRFFISVDTYKSVVAKAALDEGADIVNDISGMSFDPEMAKVIARYDCPIIVNHIRGTPKDMQKGDIYYDDVVYDIVEFFKQQINYGLENGIRPDRFIIDPGIGFGKRVEDNVEIIKRISEFRILGLPILIGISRKSFLNVILKNLLTKKDIPPKDRLYASLGATAYAVLNGVHIVRVHDVKETAEFLTILDTIRGYRVD